MSTPVLRRQSTSEYSVRVLLLHGLGCTTAMWDEFVVAADPRLQLWDVALPWHGVDNPGWSHPEDQTSVLARTVRAGEFDAVVAHSYSAGLLLEAFTEGLLPPMPAVLANAFYRSTPEQFDWPTASHYLNDFHLIFAEALSFGEGARLAGEHRSMLAASLRDQVGAYGWMRFFCCYLRSPFLNLAAVTAPQLVLCGSDDIAARAPDGRALADALPAGRFAELAGCGHFPMLQRPAEFARLLARFLTTSTGTGALAPSDDPCLELT